MSKVETIRAAGAEAGRAYAAEFPGAALDEAWLATAYEHDSAAGWPDDSYAQHYLPAARAAMEDGGGARECAYCGCAVTQRDPKTMDRAAWRAAAEEHREGCEWVATRAHTRPLVTRVEYTILAGNLGPDATLADREAYAAAVEEALAVEYPAAELSVGWRDSEGVGPRPDVDAEGADPVDLEREVERVRRVAQEVYDRGEFWT